MASSNKKKKSDEIRETSVQGNHGPEDDVEKRAPEEQTIETDRQADEARTVDIAAEPDAPTEADESGEEEPTFDVPEMLPILPLRVRSSWWMKPSPASA
jgi:hypothetical protein